MFFYASHSPGITQKYVLICFTTEAIYTYHSEASPFTNQVLLEYATEVFV